MTCENSLMATDIFTDNIMMNWHWLTFYILHILPSFTIFSSLAWHIPPPRRTTFLPPSPAPHPHPPHSSIRLTFYARFILSQFLMNCKYAYKRNVQENPPPPPPSHFVWDCLLNRYANKLQPLSWLLLLPVVFIRKKANWWILNMVYSLRFSFHTSFFFIPSWKI